MIISYRKDGNQTGVLTGAMALQFFKAYRAELWSMGLYRDPQTGDNILGMEITGMTL
jgi:hypothetical protein